MRIKTNTNNGRGDWRLSSFRTAFVVILLGAIGSAVWERILSPTLETIGQVLLSAGAAVFDGYTDQLYSFVAIDASLSFMGILLGSMAGVIITAPWLLIALNYIRIRRARRTLHRDASPAEENQPVAESREDRLKRLIDTRTRMYWLQFPAAFFITIVWASQYYQVIHTKSAAIFAERSIAILAPRLGAEGTVQLRAEFNAIDSAQDFYALEDKLKAEAARLDVTIPEFESIR